MSIKYRIVRPGAGVVTRHRTLKGAQESLARQIAGARKQGGHCQDQIEILDSGGWWSLDWYMELSKTQY